jgi:hypothetical protein
MVSDLILILYNIVYSSTSAGRKINHVPWNGRIGPESWKSVRRKIMRPVRLAGFLNIVIFYMARKRFFDLIDLELYLLPG